MGPHRKGGWESHKDIKDAVSGSQVVVIEGHRVTQEGRFLLTSPVESGEAGKDRLGSTVVKVTESNHHQRGSECL